MIASVANQSNLYVFPLDELSKDPFIARQLTSTAGGKSAAQFSPDSKDVYYLEPGRINIIPVENRQARPLAVAAEMDVDFAREKLEVFREAWTYIRDNFFDPNLMAPTGGSKSCHTVSNSPKLQQSSRRCIRS